MSIRCLALLTGLCLGFATQAAPAGGPAPQPELVVVVSPGSGISRLTRHQVQDLFLGRTLQFPDGRRAVPVDQSEGSSVREAFNALILERTSAQVRSHWARVIFTGRGRPPRDVANGEAVKQLVASDPRAIGYIERRLVDERVVVVAVE